MTQLRRRDVFAIVDGAVGAIEPKLANDLGGFNLHAHVVLDVGAEELDVSMLVFERK